MQVTADIERLQWIATNLYIRTKKGDLIQLNPNKLQLRLHMHMQAQRVRNLPVRLRMCKFRQWGGSTWLQAEAFYDIYHNANRSAMSVSVDSDSTENLFRMVQLYNSQLPAPLARKMDNTNRKEIIFSAPHRSSFLAHTAGKMSLGRSFTAQYVLASEIAFWQDAAGQMAGLNEVVPMEPGTVIVQETTGNGVGGYFYDGFMEAMRRRRRAPNDYSSDQPVFFGWNQFPDYAIEPPPGTIFSNDERRIQEEFRLTDAQLYWRQLKIIEKNGDIGLFQQEYPLTPNECFLASGSPVFAQEIIATQSVHLGESFRRVLFEESSKAIGTVPIDADDDCWIIKELPCDRHDYAMGIDTMEGRLSNLKNPRSDLDHDGVCIIDRNTGRVVAIYTGRSDQRELAQQCYRAAMYYNEAWVAPEIPQSMILLNYFRERGYQNLYNRQEHEDHYVEIESEKLGWRTTEVSRRWLVEDFVVATRTAELKVVFPEIIEQMQTFVKDARGRPGHMQGEHDDLLFAAMIAWQVVRRCPLGDRPYQAAYAGMGDPVGDEDAEINNLARIGAVDTDDDDEDDEFQEVVE